MHVFLRACVCVCVCVRAIRVIPYARLMLLTSLSYKCKWQRAPFSPTHSWRGVLKHHSSPPFTSSVDPKHTHDTVGVCVVFRAVMTNNSHALKVSTSSPHAADGRHFHAGRPQPWLDLFTSSPGLCSSGVSFFPILCECVSVCLRACVHVFVSSLSLQA